MSFSFKRNHGVKALRLIVILLTISAISSLSLNPPVIAAHRRPPLSPALDKNDASGFQVSLVEVAARAGLTEPIIYGGIDKKKYIIETNGCGVAFLDYDNDGWMDIL